MGYAQAQAYGVGDTERVYDPTELGVEELIDRLRPDSDDSKGYRPRRTHSVSAQDLSVCEIGTRLLSSIGDTKSLVEKLDTRHVKLNIRFGFDSNVVPSRDEAALKNLALALRSPVLSRGRYVIEGHTDLSGSQKYNDRLSCERAAAVRQVLRKSYGVNSERLLAVGFGFRDLLDRETPTSGKNRRVVIRLLKE